MMQTWFSRFSIAWKTILNFKNRKNRFLSDSGIICVDMTFSRKIMQTWFSRFSIAKKTILSVKNRKIRFLSDSCIICVEMTFSRKMMQTWFSRFSIAYNACSSIYQFWKPLFFRWIFFSKRQVNPTGSLSDQMKLWLL